MSSYGQPVHESVQKKIEEYEISNSGPEIVRCNAFIACVLHVDPELLSEEEWAKSWGRVKFYLETVSQVKWT